MARNILVATAFALCCSLSALAEECPAAKFMAEGLQAMEKRKDDIQREEWLLMEFLSTDAARASRKLYEQEIAKSAARVLQMSGLVAQLATLPDGAPPEQGSAGCELLTRVKVAVDELLDTRVNELADLRNKKPFLRGCQELTVAVLNLGENSREPDAKPDAARHARMVLQVGYGVQSIWAKLDGADLDRFIDVGLADSPLPARVRYGHLALWCLRHYQGAALAPLEPATEALAKCANLGWPALGRCIDPVILKPPR